MTAQSGQASTPLRIKRLTLTDFRAFPGAAPAHFDLDGKNLLVYGENGAGKSSIFHALRDFFALKPSRRLSDYRNVFSGSLRDAVSVEVTFTDGKPSAKWMARPGTGPLSLLAQQASTTNEAPLIEYHPASVVGGALSDPRVSQAALRRACLDYRALLDTNYKHGSGPVDLFQVAVNHLLRDYDYTPAGGQPTTIGDMWDKVDRADKSVVVGANSTSHKQSFIQNCESFNTAMADALPKLHPLVNALLVALGHPDLKVMNFAYGNVGPKAARLKRERGLLGGTLVPGIRYRGHDPDQPQSFLNESRLSALGLSIYLAGRLTCTPSVTSKALKLLVLDDVLIGLDHSNRLPVLDVLHKHFADWQVVLLTHDKTWFDLARERLPKDDWACCEVYEGDPAAKVPMPIVRPTMNRPAKALLQKADELLKLGYFEAAANYARHAFEMGVQRTCELKKIKMEYRLDPAAHKSQEFLDKLKSWPGSANVPKADWDAAIHRLELLKNIVMNPYSHPSAPNIPKQEVSDAIAAVTAFLDLVAKK